MDFGTNFASKGLAGTALGTGIGGLALGLLNGAGGIGSLLGGGAWINENMPVNRYEMGQERKISELEAAVALRDANTYNDQKLLEVYKYFDGKVADINDRLCKQAIHNQRTEDSFGVVHQDIARVKSELEGKIKLEAERRCCADNAIVTYVNGTFYPRSVADVTVGTTTTQALLYNPLPDCGCDCGC